ncbi:MAG: hypothetical protein PHQ17_02275 [Methanobacterium sp.]|nr:hypothetical protein [Methanobacterium sp.]
MENFTVRLKVKIPGNEYKILRILSEKLNSNPKKIIEDNLSFIIKNKNFLKPTEETREDDSIIHPDIPLNEHDSLEIIAKEKNTNIESLVASAVSLIILENKDLLLEIAEKNPDKCDSIKNELSNLEKTIIQ